MSIYLPEIDNIYFPKTREYFKEVISSYSVGNYRSATVMLYSIAICDILFKLQELKDMFNDTVAEKILKDVEKSRNSKSNGSKSAWEKTLVDKVYKDTDLLDLEAYTNLNHLYDYRNFSAHPALTETYELISPSQEITIANIKNILKDILIKPPIFIKNIVDTLTEDLKEKSKLYINEDEKFKLYLKNKYISKMSESMKLKTMRAFWKFCFLNPEDENCINNLSVNRKALGILIDSFPEEASKYIKENSQYFSVCIDNNCRINLLLLLSEYPYIYDVLNEEVKHSIENLLEEKKELKSICWFKFKKLKQHLDYLKTNKNLNLGKIIIEKIKKYYFNLGEETILIDFFIWYYGQSSCFDYADDRFKNMIEPFLNKMSCLQFKELIKVTNENSQIYNRNLAYNSNNEIMKYAKNILDDDFVYEEYKNFKFDNKIFNNNENEFIEELSDEDSYYDLPI